MGTIGVRCSARRTNLWFHLDVRIAKGHLTTDFRNDGRDDKLNRMLNLSEPWDELTDVGKRIVRRVLDIRSPFGLFRPVLGVAARPDYFDLHIRSKRAWRRVLPKVVQIIREETVDPKAAVRVHENPVGSRPEKWHEPLIRELFG